VGKIREYSADGVVVTYDAEMCIHAAECVKGLPEVFDPDRRPWIDPSKGAADAIAAVVALCPSGALACSTAATSATSATSETSDPSPAQAPGTTIKTLVNGPLRVEGAFTVVNADGEVISEKSKLSLCRCGASNNKPFCDGAHRDIGFSSEGR
jgi:uncharacterized Fe-S cluster protein YjdI